MADKISTEYEFVCHARGEWYELNIPWPPSVNTYWRHPTTGPLAGRHLISEFGRKYRKQLMDLNSAWKIYIPGRVKLRISAYPPDKRKRDLDNLFKAPLDAMHYAMFYAGDEFIDSLSIRRCEVFRPDGYLNVHLSKLEF